MNWRRLEPLIRAGGHVGGAGRLVGGGLGRVGRALWRRKGRVSLLAALLALGLLAISATWAWRTAGRVGLANGQETSIVYAAGQPLAAGLSVQATDLAGTLRRLRYREVSGPPRQAGQFVRGESAWEIFLNPRDDPRARRPPLRVRLALEGDRIAAVVSPADGRSLDGVELDPEVLSGLNDTAGQLRRPVRLSAVPRHLIAAILAAEDHRFFDHWGVDLWAVLRAVWVNLRHGEVIQGGSTLTQQLVKNLVLSHRRTWDRKLREAAVAVMLEWRYSKGEILEAYLNAIYLGQHGNAALYGVGAAAQSYFGKGMETLSVAEAALLAGMIRAPNSYSPVQNLERARDRRDVVIHRMRDLGLIDPATFTKATQERIRVQRASPSRFPAPYFLDYVRAQIEQPQADTGAQGGGLRVYTSLDPVLQRAAEATLSRGLDRLESRYRHLRRQDPTQRLQGALIALDPRTGEIRAMVGGRDYTTTQFNRAIHARRQPGSAFKPFVYLAALRFGPRGKPPRFTPVSMLEDRPLTLRYDRETWTPRNYEDRFEGTVTVRRALEQSLNAATVRLATEVGLDAVIGTAREAGFTSPMAPVPALALGSFEVTPLELAGAYATIANYGERRTPTGVRAVVDRDGSVLTEAQVSGTPAREPGEWFLLTYLLRGVVDRGTGAAARTLGVDGAVAGKTGTTNDGRDAWFVGYTRELVTLVWVGFDETDVVRLSGGQAALPIWADFMRAAMAVVPSAPFPIPTSVTFRDVDPANGKLATAYCPVVFREAFLASTEPREACPDHGPSHFFGSMVRRFFDLLK